MRACARCGEEKSEDEFRLRKSFSTGLHYRGKVCKVCHGVKSLAWRHRNADKVKTYNDKQRAKPGALAKNRKRAIELHFKRKFSITVAQRDEMLAKQGGVCKICGTDTPKGKGWCVDHNHKTNRIRAILCARCNAAVGLMDESADRLRSAADYIEVHDVIDYRESVFEAVNEKEAV